MLYFISFFDNLTYFEDKKIIFLLFSITLHESFIAETLSIKLEERNY